MSISFTYSFPVCGTSALSTVARFHLVRWFTRMEKTQLPRQSLHHCRSHTTYALHGCVLPDPSSQPYWTATAYPVHEVHVPFRDFWCLSLSLDTCLHQCWFESKDETAAERTTTYST